MDQDKTILNPWFSIWRKPRETIQQVIDNNPKQHVILLSVVIGFVEILNYAKKEYLGDTYTLPFIFMWAVITGAFIGIIGLYAGSTLLRWTGKILGGKATAEYIRAVIAWSIVPIAWSQILLIPKVALLGEKLYQSGRLISQNNIFIAIVFLFFSIFDIVVAFWAFIIFLKGLSQIQGFSIWKALFNVLLILLLLIFVISFIIFINMVLG